MAPVVKMHTLGHSFVPPAFMLAGLRYHGMAPRSAPWWTVAMLKRVPCISWRHLKRLDFRRQKALCQLQNRHTPFAVAIDEALKCKETGEKKVIVFNLSGHGHFDMSAYEAYLKGEFQDYDYPQGAIEEAMEDLPRNCAIRCKHVRSPSGVTVHCVRR